jgi:hypothetical protein
MPTILKRVLTHIYNRITKSECTIVNIATDGDAARRKLINTLKSDNLFLEQLQYLDKFDQKFLFGSIGDTQVNLLDQLVNLSELSFILIIIYRRHGGAFLTSQLYLDIQSTIQDAFITTAWFKKKAQSEPHLLFLHGTDQLESLFSIIRTVTHSNNCDFLELIEKLKAARQVENIYNKYPYLAQSSRLTVTTLDHSSVQSWKGELIKAKLA